MQTVIKAVDVEWVGSGTKKYGKATVTHDAGKGEKKQYLVSFKNPEVFKKVQEMVGQTVDVENVKDGDFWTWKSIQVTGTAPAQQSSTSAGATRVSGSNYETKEERAARQVLIVKQSSLSAAVATLTPGAKAPLDPETVIKQAQQYTNWVFSISDAEDKTGFDTMIGDIPF